MNFEFKKKMKAPPSPSKPINHMILSHFQNKTKQKSYENEITTKLIKKTLKSIKKRGRKKKTKNQKKPKYYTIQSHHITYLYVQTKPIKK